MTSFVCCGTKGDVIVSLYIVKAMGGGHVFIRPGEFEEKDLESVIESCGKLVTSQPYVRSFRIHRGEPIDVDLDIWRKNIRSRFRKTLLEIMCEAQGLRLNPPIGAWMDVPPHPDLTGKIVIHRRMSKRPGRANPRFDWDRLFSHFGVENFVFVSRLEYEWKEFGHPEVAYFRPADMFEHAQAIKACRLFVGNQSMPSALADALGVDRIFELATGRERKHFSVTYATNAWYFASLWDSTIKDFRYVQTCEPGIWLDLFSGEKTAPPKGLSSVLSNKKAFVHELGFWLEYWTFAAKQNVKAAIGVSTLWRAS